MENTTNATNNNFILTGLFKDKESAGQAYQALSERGYGRDSLDVIMTDKTRDEYSSGIMTGDAEPGTKAAEGTGVGAAVGGSLGAVLAAIAAIGTSIVLPGLGLVVAGPLAAALMGAGAGGITGGLVGALIGSGIPEEHAQIYESGVKSGGILLRASALNAEDASYLESKWRSCGGEQVYSIPVEQNSTSANAPDAQVMNTPQQGETKAGEVTIPVIEEELQVGKRTVETGGVRVETNITERPVEETVTLREEEINVERRPVNRAVTDDDVSAVEEGEIVVPERAEQAVVGKEARVVEEVVIGKDVTERTETINDTVRRTEVDVEELSGEEMKNRKSSVNRMF